MGEVKNKYQVMPPLSEEEFQALKEDIAEHGIKMPVVKDPKGNIIDGHHRVRAYEELFAEGRVTEGTDAGGYPTFEVVDATEQEMRNLAWSLNLQRRHLDRAQKREAVRAKLKESPEWTDTRIAKLLGVSDKTVRSVREEAESVSEIPKLNKLVGEDGKEYPRHRVRETPPASEPDEEWKKPVKEWKKRVDKEWKDSVSDLINGSGHEEPRPRTEPVAPRRLTPAQAPPTVGESRMTTERPGQPGAGMTPARQGKSVPKPPESANHVTNILKAAIHPLTLFGAKDSAEVVLRSTDEDIQQARTEAMEAAAWLDSFLEVLDGEEEE